MKELWTLVKKDLLVDYPILSNPSAALKDKKLRKKAMLQPVIWVILGVYLWIFMGPVLGLYDIYKSIGVPLSFLAMGFLAFVMILILFTVPYILSKIYFSQDVENMLTLPVKKENILRSKLVAIGLSTLFYGLVTVIPFLIKFGIEEGKGIVYYLYGLAGLLLTALSIISIIAFLIILLMGWIGKFPKAKNVLQFLGLLLIMALSIGMNIYIQSQVNMDGSGIAMENIAKSTKFFIDKALPAFPQVRWLIFALDKSAHLEGLVYFGYSLLFTLVVTFVLTKVSSPLMLKGVLENRTVGQKKAAKASPGANKRQAVWKNLAQKEILDILKTPLYAMNTLSVGIIFPLVMIFPTMVRTGLSVSEALKMGRDIWGMIPLQGIQLFLGGIALGILVGTFLGSTGSSSTTSFSREGKKIWMMQTLPIAGKDQLLGRLFAGLTIHMISLLPILLLLLVFLPPVHVYLGVLLGGLLSGVFVSMIGLFIDLLRPKLQWDNPQEAMKQNVNVFIGMVINWCYLALIGYILYKLRDTLLQGKILLPVLGVLFAQIAIPLILAVLFIKLYQRQLLDMNA